MAKYEIEAIHSYGDCCDIESGYRPIKRFMVVTTSKNSVLGFFYLAFACLLYSVWRAVGLFVQGKLTSEYVAHPLVIPAKLTTNTSDPQPS